MLLASIITYLYVIRHTRKAKLLYTITNKNRSRNSEIRMTKTLMQMVAAFSFMTLPSMIALIIATVTSNINPNEPRKFNIHAYNAIDTLGIIGYLCLTCSTILNFFIYNISNDIFRKCIVQLMVGFSNKLRFRCLTKILCMKRNINKTTIVATSSKEYLELNNRNSSAV